MFIFVLILIFASLDLIHLRLYFNFTITVVKYCAISKEEILVTFLTLELETSKRKKQKPHQNLS